MEDFGKIRERSEIPVEDTWATEDLYATDEAWEQELETLKEDKDTLASFAGKLSQSAKVNHRTCNGSTVDFKISRMNNNSFGCVYGKNNCIGYTVV